MKTVFRRTLPFAFLAPFALAASATLAQTAPPTAEITAPGDTSLTALVDQVQIPYERFTLENGLTTLVHTDRKAPIVGVTVYYRVGSRHEPRGRTGFAHLFEHLMFGGSENVENFDIPLEAAGSTSTNGSTWYDRTNYVETVPTGALDLALFMESDRMGYLLGAVSQEKLDNQRMVVQNEKRQGDNQPYGLVDYLMADGMLPVGHPYRHATIGSMADLEAASLTDVQDWFRSNYGPNNVVLVLAGDIDAATARPMVERWFGAIPRGPEVAEAPGGPVTLAAPVRQVVTDQVPATHIYRTWTGPEMTSPDAIPLTVGMYILGGLASSRLDNAMVRGDEIATSASAYSLGFEKMSQLITMVEVKDGVEPEEAEAKLVAETERLVTEGPTADELERAKTTLIASTVGGLERVGGFGGKGMVLAEGELYTGDADHYRKELEAIAALTPAQVQGALERWLSRPAYTLSVVPGQRTLDGATMGGWGDEDLSPPPAPDARAPVEVTRTAPPREAPPVLPVGELTFPAVEHATLSNGIEVVLARREAVPMVSMTLTFAAGSVVDPADAAGRHETMMDLLTEGTTTRSALDIAIAQEELGSSLSAAAGVETSQVTLTTLTSNLAPSVALMADVTLNPAFRAEDVARVKEQRLAEIAQELASPGSLASKAFMPLIYGADHPYAHASSSGDAAVVEALTPAVLKAEHDRWLRPDLAQITVVGDVSMPELVAALEAGFGGWKAPAAPAPTRHIDAPAPAPHAQIVGVNRPNSPSSYLMLGRVTPLVGEPNGIEVIETANEVLGGGFLSRLMGDLRETKGWTYGIGSSIPAATGQRRFTIATQVQADRTGDSIVAIVDQLKAFPATAPVDPVELQRVTDGNVRGLPNRFETNGQVLGALVSNRVLGRDIRYQAQLPDIYRAMDAAIINAAAADYLTPDNLTIVVVGDRETVAPQLEQLGMEVTWLDAEAL
ncbi:insulinase family protein [Aurantiacibacter xanthus]|uniref:Insulinase family protein n=1 Tax=Aurantiacibacter xanthus TaxID=1784712 RepID=A0A3A1P1R5_9SPHN|nr:pitrilysin family protein [Aurantiacibacter xanthus]RIV83233.1 insulinase family protein [Aurantiacibacter xanthus]